MWKISIICVFAPFFYYVLFSAVTVILLLVSEIKWGSFPIPLVPFFYCICPVMTEKIWGWKKSECERESNMKHNTLWHILIINYLTLYHIILHEKYVLGSYFFFWWWYFWCWIFQYMGKVLVDSRRTHTHTHIYIKQQQQKHKGRR